MSAATKCSRCGRYGDNRATATGERLPEGWLWLMPSFARPGWLGSSVDLCVDCVSAFGAWLWEGES